MLAGSEYSGAEWTVAVVRFIIYSIRRIIHNYPFNFKIYTVAFESTNEAKYFFFFDSSSQKDLRQCRR